MNAPNTYLEMKIGFREFVPGGVGRPYDLFKRREVKGKQLIFFGAFWSSFRKLQIIDIQIDIKLDN